MAKLKILTKVLADTPEREDARIPLFRAAVSAPEDEFALASIEQMLREQRIRQVAPNVTNGEDEIISDDRSDAEQNAMTSIYAGAKLPPTQQAQIAQAVGLTLARLNRFGEALAYMQVGRSSGVSRRACALLLRSFRRAVVPPGERLLRAARRRE